MASLKDSLINQLKQQETEDCQNENGLEKLKPSLLFKQKFNNLFLEMKNSENLQEIRSGLHASAIVGPESSFCYRQQVFSLIYEMSQGKDLPVNALRIFRAGEDIHAKWQEMLEKCSGKNGIEIVKCECRSYNEKWKLLFTPDIIIKIDGIPYIVEIKSMNTYSYKKAVCSSNPHPHARHQIQLYMHLTGIHRGLILIEDKNTQDFEVFQINYNYKEVLPYIDRLNEIAEQYKDYQDEGIEPIRICENENCKKAMECNMRFACFHAKSAKKLK